MSDDRMSTASGPESFVCSDCGEESPHYLRGGDEMCLACYLLKPYAKATITFGGRS